MTYREMKEQDFTVSSLNGEMDVKERELIMQEFRTGTSRLLIITNK